jgi:hypothetical protein
MAFFLFFSSFRKRYNNKGVFMVSKVTDHALPSLLDIQRADQNNLIQGVHEALEKQKKITKIKMVFQSTILILCAVPFVYSLVGRVVLGSWALVPGYWFILGGIVLLAFLEAGTIENINYQYANH